MESLQEAVFETAYDMANKSRYWRKVLKAQEISRTERLLVAGGENGGAYRGNRNDEELENAAGKTRQSVTGRYVLARCRYTKEMNSHDQNALGKNNCCMMKSCAKTKP